jgi:hypothetical protein
LSYDMHVHNFYECPVLCCLIIFEKFFNNNLDFIKSIMCMILINI